MSKEAVISRRVVQTYERQANEELHRIKEHARQLSATQEAEVRAQLFHGERLMAMNADAQRALLQREAEAHSELIEQRARFQSREAMLTAEAAAALSGASTHAQARDEVHRIQEAAAAEMRQAMD